MQNGFSMCGCGIYSLGWCLTGVSGILEEASKKLPRTLSERLGFDWLSYVACEAPVWHVVPLKIAKDTAISP